MSEPSLPLTIDEDDSITLKLGVDYIQSREVTIPQPEPDTYALILIDNGYKTIILTGLSTTTLSYLPGEVISDPYVIDHVNEDHVLSYSILQEPLTPEDLEPDI